MKRHRSMGPLAVVLGLTLIAATAVIAALKLGNYSLPGQGPSASVSETQSAPEQPSAPVSPFWQLAGDADAPRVVLSTTEGDITVMLSDTAAARAFAEMADAYSGAQVCRLVPESYLQIASPGSADIAFEDTGLWCFRGAVGFICQENAVTAGLFIVTADSLDTLSRAYISENGYEADVAEAYSEVGGVPELDEGHLVFGQVVSGWSALERLAAKESAGVSGGYAPLEPDVIEEIKPNPAD